MKTIGRGMLIAVLVALNTGTSNACVGTGCIQIWSTADGSGQLSIFWDFTKKVQTYESFCTSDNSQCLYSTIDPGFMAPPADPPPDGLFRIASGTKVRIVIVHADAGLDIQVNGQKLYQPGDSALLGTMPPSTMPPIHNHPAWQIVVAGNQFGDFQISYRLTAAGSAYSDSDVYTQTVTNVPPPELTPTPTPQATPTPPPCPGDCNDSLDVSVDELVTCVNIALGNAAPATCPACDHDGDGMVTIDEIVAAVSAALNGCPTPPPATLAEIQQTIFTPRCAIPTCHDAASGASAGDLVLTDGQSYGFLVDVPPNVSTARDAGVLRVDAGMPGNSFLLMKVTGPPLGEGSLMPLIGAPLTAEQIQLIRDWILQGAKR